MLKLVELQLPFLLWLQGRKPSLSQFISEDDDSSDGNHDLCDDDDVETISSLTYVGPRQLHLPILSYSGSNRQKKNPVALCLMPISVTPADLQ